MFWRKKVKNLRAIYAMHALDGLANSLIGIFIPIYLLDLGYSIVQVLSYYLVYYTAGLLSAFFSAFLSSRLGIKHVIFARFPILFLYLIMLLKLQEGVFPIYAVAAVGGFQLLMYWTPLNVLFSRNISRKRAGASTGKLFAWPQAASIGGPVAGGLIAGFFGFTVLFGVAFVLFAFSVIPLFVYGLDRVIFDFEPKKGVSLLRKYPRYFFVEILGNIGDEVEAIIWPMFIFLSLVSVEAVGIAGASLAIGSILLTLTIGKWSDKLGKRKLAKMGAVFLMIVWCLRYFADTEISFYALTVISGFAMVLLWVPYHSKIYSIANKDNIDEFLVFREIPVTIGRVIILLVAMLFVGNLQLLFPLTALAYIYFLFL